MSTGGYLWLVIFRWKLIVPWDSEYTCSMIMSYDSDNGKCCRICSRLQRSIDELVCLAATRGQCVTCLSRTLPWMRHWFVSSTVNARNQPHIWPSGNPSCKTVMLTCNTTIIVCLVEKLLQPNLLLFGGFFSGKFDKFNNSCIKHCAIF